MLRSFRVCSGFTDRPQIQQWIEAGVPHRDIVTYTLEYVLANEDRVDKQDRDEDPLATFLR